MQLCLFIAILAAALLFSCTKAKEDTSSPNPVRDTSRPVVRPDTTNPIVKQDTLNAGWSKKVIDGESFNDIFFNNNQTGYLTGKKIYESTDGGMNWNVKFNVNDFHDIFVTNNGKAYFVNAYSGLWHLAPGGANLTKSMNETGKNSMTTDVYFTDDNVGYYIGGYGLFKTTDGGTSWNMIYSKNIAGRFNYLNFINQTTGWFFLGKQLFKTNGYSIFDQIYTSTTDLTCIKAISSTVIYVGDIQGQIFKSTDGGVSFQLLSKLSSTTAFTDLHFINSSLGYACAGSSIYKTTDGGATWNKVVVLQGIEIIEIHFTDENHGWACGTNGATLIYKG